MYTLCTVYQRMYTSKVHPNPIKFTRVRVHDIFTCICAHVANPAGSLKCTDALDVLLPFDYNVDP